MNGAAIGIWAANIPGVKEHLALNPQSLSYGFLAMAVGALIGMPLGGALIGRFGSAHLTRISGFIFILLLPMPILSPNLPLLIASLGLFGLTNGVMDVAMNAHGVLVERQLGKPVVSSFHAMWSVGGLVGSACGGWALVQIGPAMATFAAAALALVVFISACFFTLPSHLDRQSGEGHFAMPSRTTLALGLLAFLAMMSEGAVLDWSGLYLRDLAASPALAASGFAGFSGTMAFGRFFGDALRGRFGAGRLVQVSGLIGVFGIGIALLSSSAAMATLGFALLGLGIANIAPVIYGAAGRLEGVASGASIASVITMGYAGFMVGPALIGFVAQHASLTIGIAVVGLACAAIAMLGSAAET
eukprot:gene6966-7042_t